MNTKMDGATKIMWHLGWNPVPTYVFVAVLAFLGWAITQHPAGMFLGLFGLIPRWKGIKLINSSWQTYLGEAESFVKGQGASRLGVILSAAQCTVLRTGRGEIPFGTTPNPEYAISVIYICDAFFAVYQDAIASLKELDIQLPGQGEEVYFRHVSVVNYNPPNIEVTLSNGKTMKPFTVGSDGASVLGALRAKLRSSQSMVSRTTRSVSEPEIQEIHTDGQQADPDVKVTQPDDGSDERHCCLRLSKLRQLLADPSVVDVLVEQLEVPGAPKNLKPLTVQAKMELIETQIDHFRRTPTSVWYGVPTLEVLAASIWRASDDPFYREKGLLTKKLVQRGWFCGVSEEDDLKIPVAKWLIRQGLEAYMEIPLGTGRVDVLGYKKPGLSSSNRLLAIELKNDYEQFKRAFNQMGTFAEYTNVVYMACTPAFVAEYLDHNESSTGHWDWDVLERKLTAGGFGLLVVERDQVFEVVKPVERTPSSENSGRAVSALSAVNLIEC
jgi:hypothetical protein